MGFDNQKNEFVQLPTPLPPSSPSVQPPQLPENVFSLIPALLPPPKPPDLKSLSDEVSAPPPTILSPPPEPPDPLLRRLTMGYALTRYPESTMRKPPKPPDPKLLSEILLPPPAVPPPEPLLTGPLPRPPPKPNYRRSHSKIQPPSDPPDQNITSLGQMFDACRKFSFSITMTRTISTGNQPFKQNTIRVILQPPIIGRHVAVLVLILSCVWHLLSRLVSAILGVERCVLILTGEHICFVSIAMVGQPLSISISMNGNLASHVPACKHVTASNVHWPKYSINGLHNLCPRVIGPIFILDNFCLETNSNMLQISFKQNLVDSPRTRPARKPPDLHLNLEDKVQVNPAAMIED
ncbi:hypothetical protein QL285_046586 [Trifolium repens]|nr:hypothetical protein QL285_046586 [Trifolium repens]